MTLEKFVFDLPLYQKVSLNEDTLMLEDILMSNISHEDNSFEGYNPLYKTDSTFKITQFIGYKNPKHPYNYQYYGLPYALVLTCKRYHNKITVLVHVDTQEKYMMKVGQYPSVADIHIGEIKQYKKVLPDDKLREFTKAIGLAANGVGIGSFVYLRRIFEFLIVEASINAVKDNIIDNKTFTDARMEDRIKMLKSYLPAFLVENKSIYAILSTGVHELSEDECLSYFDIMRTSIELILDEKLEHFEKEEKIKLAKAKLSAVTAKIKRG